MKGKALKSFHMISGDTREDLQNGLQYEDI